MSTAAATIDRPTEVVANLCYIQPRPVSCAFIIISGDVVAVAVSFVLAIRASAISDAPNGVGSLYWHFAATLAACVLAFCMVGLYPGITVEPVAEIRRTTVSCTGAFLTLLVLSLLSSPPYLSRDIALCVGWATCCILVPLLRSWLRILMSRRVWWGYPVVVFGAGATGTTVLAQLQAHPEIGFRPVAVLGPGSADIGDSRVFKSNNTSTSHAFARAGVRHAIIATPEVPHKQLVELMDSDANVFPHLLIIPRLEGAPVSDARVREVCGIFTLDIHKQLLLRKCQVAKRTLDLLFVVGAGVFALPLAALIAVSIMVESRGPVLFSHRRVGKNGRSFQAWKFRSMVVNGAPILQEYFSLYPEELEQWRQTQKLKNDPRITMVGRFLRRTSLDELPQLWNVLKGEMSVVGPRPIVEEEIVRYGDQFELYKQVIPGLTGLWQVSGRSNTTYQDRVRLDTFYVRNWSPWLDIYLIAKTIRVVLKAEGAY